MLKFMSAFRSAFALLIALGCAASSKADLKLASPFSDNMVLQRNQPVAIWGEADPGAAIDLAIGSEHQKTTTDAAGHWTAHLPAMKTSLEPRNLRVESAGKTIELRNILVGDVWLCAGQSNMQMGLHEIEGGEAEVRDAGKQTRIRLLTIPKQPADTPQTHFAASWLLPSSESAKNFTAVGYTFGRELLSDPTMAEVPVGLIDCSFGGTTAEAWTSPEALAPFQKTELLDSMFGIKPAGLSHGMIAPLAPYSLTGVLWYQGESNAGRPELYPRVLSAMISDWRQKWGQPALPFFIVQLPPFVGHSGDYSFAALREAEAKAVAATPNTALAVTIDTTDGFDLHPKQKREIGRRLSLLARKMVYGEDIIASGPQFKEAIIEGASIRVFFDTHGDGLERSGQGPLRGFALAGEDGQYHFADAFIDRDSVIVGSSSVPSPKTVRYAWGGVPDATLRGKSGLPVAPFRTDDVVPKEIELQKQMIARQLSTSAYEIAIAGDGKVTSLAVHGKQFLSNSPGLSGGTTIPVLFGARALPDIRDLGPNLLSASDNEVTLLMKFGPQSMEWTLTNRGTGDMQFRIALAAGVSVGPRENGTPITLTRGKATLSISGIDSIGAGEDGKILTATLKGGATKRLELTAGGQ